MNMLEKVIAKVAEVQTKLEKYGYPKIKIVSQVTTLKPGRAGEAWTNTGEIKISVDFMREHESDVLNVTVPHEVCHHYVWAYHRRAKQHHGPEFRMLMNLLGLDGKTYHTMQLTNAPVRKTRTVKRYVYVTVLTNQEVRLTSQQHNKQQARMCYRAKGENIKFTGIVETH